MRKTLPVIALLSAGLVAGCANVDDEVAAGAIVGASAGALIGDKENRTRNVLIGTVAGAAVGNVINENNQCRYRNTYTGATYIADCP